MQKKNISKNIPDKKLDNHMATVEPVMAYLVCQCGKVNGVHDLTYAPETCPVCKGEVLCIRTFPASDY